jgi:predicted RNA-binding Zn-ribbon protein involved in translation (DUF1610 family)
MNLVGYKIGGQFNDTHMFRDDSSLRKCDGCGYRLDFYATNPKYCLPKCSDDISATYDGQTIVSKAFKDLCERNKYQGITFGIFENDPNHFHLSTNREVAFDAKRRKTRFESLCPQCGNYESIVGANPVYLLVTGPLDDYFHRSDLLFASGNGKHPLTIIGVETKAKLEAANLKGLEFAPAFGLDP